MLKISTLSSYRNLYVSVYRNKQELLMNWSGFWFCLIFGFWPEPMYAQRNLPSMYICTICTQVNNYHRENFQAFDSYSGSIFPNKDLYFSFKELLADLKQYIFSLSL